MASLGDSTAPLVFVSSTVEDFRDLRSALRFWLDSLGYRRFMSEFTGSDKVLGPGTYDACFEAIHRADLYVLLIGDRRGSLISEDPKRSITEAEYDVAYQSRRKTGRPKLLCFVRDEVARDIRRSNPELKYQDLKHTQSFIDKVERIAETNAAREGKGDPPADNWLHRFREFSDIATEIDSALGITGSVREARQRDLLREELAEILRKFVGAHTMSWREHFDADPEFGKRVEELFAGSIPKEFLNEEVRLPRIWHRIADGVFEPLIELHADPMGTVKIDDYGTAFKIASFSMMVGPYAAIECPRLDEASRSGTFRRYDAQTRATEPTDLQQAVDRVRRDLRALQSMAQNMEEASARVRVHLAPLSRNRAGSVGLRRSDVTEFAGLHNSVHNIFVRLASLLEALLGQSSSPFPGDDDLRSHSPFPNMDQEVARETATPEEILGWTREGLFEPVSGK